MKRVCVFCASSPGARPIYGEVAQELGRSLVRRGLGLVYGGSTVGLMGAIANATLAAGGDVIGVIPKALVEREIAHRELTELHIVASMHERKALMNDLCDAFIALPGGFGTLEEFAEVLTWAQLGLHRKPCGLLNVRGYYDALIRFFDTAVEEQMLQATHRATVLEAQTCEELLDRLSTYQSVPVPKWIGRDET